MSRLAAHLPQARIGLVPDAREVVQQRALEVPVRRPLRKTAAPRLV
jgi:hypothetical protein